MHVGSVAIFDAGDLSTDHGGIDIDRLRDYVAAKLHRVPRYRQRIAYTPFERHPIWVDDPHFNVFYHVRHTALPRPGDERQLKRLAGRLMSQQLDRGKPLWELWVVEGLQGGRFGLISKVHHCMIDGISGAEILQQLFTPHPQLLSPPPKPYEPRPLPSRMALIRNTTGNTLQTPRTLLTLATRTVAAPRDAVRKSLETLPAVGRVVQAWSQSASVTPINKPIGPHRRFDWLDMDFRRVKYVKNMMGATVNDLVLTIVSMAMTRFFERRGIDPKRQEELRFRVFCPISLRSAEEKNALGNRVAMPIVDLPLGDVAHETRLAKVQQSFGRFRETKQALAAHVLTSVGEWVAPSLATLSVRMSYKRHAGNLVVTNVPGPQIELYLLGARMLQTYPVVPLYIEQCLGIALFSYAGHLYWGFNADWDTMPDLHDLVEDVEAVFNALEAHFTKAAQSA